MKMTNVRVGVCAGWAVVALAQVGYGQDREELKMLSQHAALQEMAARLDGTDPGGSAFEVGCMERDGVLSCRGFSDCQCEALGGFFDDISGVCAVETDPDCGAGIEIQAPRLRDRGGRDGSTQINTSCTETPLDYCCEPTIDGRIVCKGFTIETCTGTGGMFDYGTGECEVSVAVDVADDLQLRDDPERPGLDIISPDGGGVAELDCHVNAWSWLVCVGDYLPVCPDGWAHHANNTCCYPLD